jgi:replicative superfamily II helicase
MTTKDWRSKCQTQMLVEFHVRIEQKDLGGPVTEIASPAEMNPAQAAVVARGLLTSGFNCVLQMPTGSGKTWLGEQAIEATLKAGGRAIYLTPLRALANELLMRWRTRFSDVGLAF